MTPKEHPRTDSARSLALLWSSQTEVGRSGLSLKAIVTAAIELVDAEGIEALSMRNVAQRIGAGTMSLYTHVPSKADLIDLMIDTAYGQLYEDIEQPSRQQGGWRGALRFIAKQNWDLYRKHPWMLHMISSRPVLGPHASIKYEAELRPLDQQGLSDIEMDAILTLVLTHVEGCARAQAALDRVEKDTNMTEVEWWLNQAPALNKLINPAHFPVATRVGRAAGEHYQGASNPEFALTFGLERILDGIADLIAAKKKES